MTTVEKIIEYFENDENTFNDAVEELDSYNGWLNDNRFFLMEDINEFYSNPLEAMTRVYYGHDAETYTTDEYGNKHYSEFNPNREYFYYNGYGNLVSCDDKDYSDYLTEETIREMNENRAHIWAINNNYELSELFDELDEANEEN